MKPSKCRMQKDLDAIIELSQRNSPQEPGIPSKSLPYSSNKSAAGVDESTRGNLVIIPQPKTAGDRIGKNQHMDPDELLQLWGDDDQRAYSPPSPIQVSPEEKCVPYTETDSNALCEREPHIDMSLLSH